TTQVQCPATGQAQRHWTQCAMGAYPVPSEASRLAVYRVGMSNPRPLECHPSGAPSHQTTSAHKLREHRAVPFGAFASCGPLSTGEAAENAQSISLETLP